MGSHNLSPEEVVFNTSPNISPAFGLSVYEQRRKSLAEIDSAPVGLSHLRAVLVAGTGFFTDAYDLFSANFITSIIGLVYFSGHKIPTSADTSIKLSTTAGAVIGQVIFGWLADKLGRKRMYGLELIIMLVGTFGQTITGQGPAVSFLGPLIFWRVIMGVGVGGDYPLSSVITSEFATVKWRGALMNAVFAMQGFGNLAAGLVSFVCVVASKDALLPAATAAQCDERCQLAADKMWRSIVAFGTVPALLAVYFRLTIPETPRYTSDITLDVEKARADVQAYLRGKRQGKVEEGHTYVAETRRRNESPKATWSEFFSHFRQWRHGKILLGTAGSWFFIDVAFWGLGLNNSAILGAIGYASSQNVYDNLYNTAVGNLILAVAGNIPGYWVSVALIDTVGRKPIQMASFIILTILFCVIGFGYHSLSAHTLLGLYVLCQFFSNFGANSTTFIVPGEVYPTRFRSTAHGISAAAGKVGAVLAQALIGPLRNKTGTNKWLNHVMEIFALFMLCGIFTTLLIPETKRQTLEELAEKYHGDSESIDVSQTEEAIITKDK
ncbi:MFS transporter, PHS family, inorganic phosphate transporter [Cladophialophora psammophila CBS 110553]|uniref:MFS transporter, PHS family, inorganic phosphate transporter n=1 Tax=Cladophialophora psammophila CBS 110553 TaxID=1182543 RepID=W9VY52_9EURO|nr:MFS transporter, PHS family, inorganic phosphate transporter [Cladophialophora psammophila CBS 110553]EXJ57650.1 MFS transporter, PHS family, inorganic phosphate transporter [Cladophialophora psammophila CBS 110553]